MVVTAWVDDRLVNVEYGYTVMQSCALMGIDIPRFCYHDKLLIAGNCRICLVEVFGKKKLVISCAKRIRSGMRIFTNTIRVRLARQGVLEFLLSNHPLDCPICDQGGECDLQDISLLYASDRGRYYEYTKRAVFNKDFGPLIRTSMNRCIHCTRCIRFLRLSTGNYQLGFMGRGMYSEITTYIEHFISDPLSGNVIDLCPVGALTSKPYSFKIRPWELTSIESVDVFDSLNSNVLFEVFSNQVFRVLPYLCEGTNEDWITNKARFSYDGLFVQRVFSCFLKFFFFDVFSNIGMKVVCTSLVFFIKVPLNVGLHYFCRKIFSEDSFSSFFFFMGPLLDFETIARLRYFLFNLGLGNLRGANLVQEQSNCDFDSLYLFNVTLSFITRLPSLVFFVFSNTRFESPLLNFRFSRLYLEYNVDFFSVGVGEIDINFPILNISTNLLSLFDIFEFKHFFCHIFYEFWFFNLLPFFVFSSKIMNGFFNLNVFFSLFFCFLRGLYSFLASSFYLVFFFNKNTGFLGYFSNFGVLHLSSTFVQVSEILFNFENILLIDMISKCNISGVFNKSILYYSVGYSSSSLLSHLSSNVSGGYFLVYQGSHSTELLFLADLVFPTLTYVEKSSVFKNIFGLLRRSEPIIMNSLSVFSDSNLWNFLYSEILFSFFDVVYWFGNDDYINSSYFYLYDSANYRFMIPLYDVCMEYIGKSFGLLRLFYYFELFFVFNFLRFLVFGEFLGLLCNSLCFGNLGLYTRSPLSVSSINYYSDESNFVIKSSRIMSLCSSSYLNEMNLSFPS